MNHEERIFYQPNLETNQLELSHKKSTPLKIPI